jgi:hypothetical protein
MNQKFVRNIFLYFLMIGLMPAIAYSQPTEEQILVRIESGIDWLVAQQQGNGSWYEQGEPIATTGFALTKLCDYAIEHGYSPFDPDYEYNAEVVAGFNYIFGTIRTYGAGTGMCATPVALGASNHHEIYNAAVALMALAASKSPTEIVTVGLASSLTFLQLQNNMIEYFEWAQDDNAVTGGGWRYTPNGGSDNSHTGWVVLALRYAEVNGSNIPTAIKSKLDTYIDYIQCDGNGGSGYVTPCDGWTNTLKTGNLLTEMAFVGDDVGSARVQAALNYINNAWNTSANPGYGDTQAMYCLLKGFESYGDPVGAPTAWFDDFTTLLFSWSVSGGWPGSYWTGPIISTCWALMVLEKVAPPPVCPDDIVVNNDMGECGAVVTFDVTAHYLATITQTSGLPSGSLFPVGITDQEFEIDLEGEITYCTFTVTVIDAEPPVAICENVNIELDEFGNASIMVDDIDGGSSDNCSFITTASPLDFNCSNLGDNIVTLTVTDPAGNVAECQAIVNVADMLPPVITVVEPITLWSPNHKYSTFELEDLVTGVYDNCSELNISDVKIVKVTSDEPEDMYGNGDGKTFEDMIIADDCMSVQLRSEREGTGNGRVYTVYLELTDNIGNIVTSVCFVNVPHDMNSIAVDDGFVYEVLGDCMNKSGKIVNNQQEIQGYKLTNYPNPFSVSTTIEFTIPAETSVMLKVYNLFGQELVTLVNQRYIPGTYNVHFDAAKLPAGQYLYRFNTSDFTLTKKMILNR